MFYDSAFVPSRISQYDVHRCISKNDLPRYLMDWYEGKCGYRFNIEAPITFNEKIQWMKLYGKLEQYTNLTDKLQVRRFIRDRIGEKYLTKLFGVWDTFSDIPFSQLPLRVMLKCNHGCEMNMLINKEIKIDVQSIKNLFSRWHSINYAFFNGFEFQYNNIKPLYFAEEYLENSCKTLDDYKIWCFNGKPHFILCIRNRGEKMQQQFYDTSWNVQDFVTPIQYSNCDIIKQPNNLSEMLEISAELSQNIPFVRIDLYRLDNGDIKFGEMTFTPASGTFNWNPRSWNTVLGNLFILP